jgi:hypothetical protein
MQPASKIELFINLKTARALPLFSRSRCSAALTSQRQTMSAFGGKADIANSPGYVCL